ncbi:sigma-E factor negative regulatory protein [Variovorax sp. LjRoot84]|uniref:sigma-E factor negative regulatory protein n=1 Tax=Variovorax sp. LjRoot84 TaxID=3342340 RepID=UPI003ECDBB7C
MDHPPTSHVQISALADGQLREGELAHAIGDVCGDEELRTTWRTYQLVGEVLRSGVHPSCSDTSFFLAKFQHRLAAESPAPAPFPEALLGEPRSAGANEPVFWWKLVAGFASLTATSAIGWYWVSGDGVQPAATPLAHQQGSGSVLAASRGPPQTATSRLTPTQVVIGTGAPSTVMRNQRLDQLLEAHQQAGGASQMPTGFLRNATLEGPWR